MPANPRLFERDPFHKQYAKRRDFQSKIIFAKLRHELLNGKLPTLQQRIYMESAAVSIIELKAMQTKFMHEKRTRVHKDFYSILNTLRNTLNQIQPKGKPGKPIKGGESVNLGEIING